LEESGDNLRVLVTGATGFIGEHVARRFADRGAKTFALVRPPVDRLHIPGVESIAGDIEDAASLQEAAICNPQIVCHLAANTSINAPASEMEANLRGTENLIRCFGDRLRGIRFLFASSIAAIDRKRRPTGPLTEDDPPAPRSPYAVSKLQGENFLTLKSAESGFHLANLRLGTVYGPGAVKGGVVALAESVRLGKSVARIRWPGRISFAYVDDVAEVFYRLATRSDPLTGSYFVADPYGHTMAEVVDLLNSLQQLDAKSLPIPAWMFGAVRTVMWWPGVRRYVPWSLRAALDDTILCDSGKITRLLDMKWTPLEEGLRRTFG
jgi:UDP-glucose 4-epimerase